MTATESTITIPAELWMLERLHEDTRELTGHWCVPKDAPPDGENYLVCLSEADAIAAAKHQGDNYGVECRPIRVK